MIAACDAATQIRLVAAWAVFFAGATAFTAGTLVTGAVAEKAPGVSPLLVVAPLAGRYRRANRVRTERTAALPAQAHALRAEQQVHWFPRPPATWCVNHHGTTDTITDGLIFMAVAMLLTRTAALATRAARLPAVV